MGKKATRHPGADHTTKPANEALEIGPGERSAVSPTRRGVRGTEARYRRLLDASPDAIAIHREGRYVYANASAMRLLGARDLGEILGEPLLRFVHPDDRELAISRVRRVASGESLDPDPMRLLSLDGREIYVEITGIPTTWQGKPAVQALARDVTARRDAEQRLRDSEKKYRDLVETSSDVIWAVDREGRFTFVNQAVRRVFGREPEECLGQGFDLFLDPRQAGVDREAFLTAIEGEAFRDYEGVYLAKDGKVVRLSTNSRIARDPQGAVAGLTGISRDITASSEAEERLRESEAKFKKIFHDGPSAIALNRESDGAYVDVNEEFLKLSGWRREEVIGRTPGDLGIWEQREDLHRVLQELARKGFVRNLECAFRRKEGAILEGLFSATEVEMSGHRCILSFIRDVSDLRRAERELAVSRRQLAVSEKLSTLGTLVSGVAHEIRTPSAYIANNIFLVRHRLAEVAKAQPQVAALFDEVAGWCDGALEGIARIDRLVRDLRRFTRHDTTGRAETGLHEVVEVALKIFRAAQQGKFEVRAELEPTPLLRLDPEQIHQVVLNLLNNGAEAMGEGGTIRVATRPVTGGGEIEIEDGGPGIPPEVQERVFDPFFTTKPDGTGLGLPIARRIVESHGGTIRFENRPGAGSRFVVFLPRTSAVASVS